MHKPSTRKRVLILTMLAGLLACGSAHATWCLFFPWLCAPPPPPPEPKCDKCELLRQIRDLSRSSDSHAQKINTNTSYISNNTQSISNHTQNISNIENKNYNTTNEYKKWVTNNYYGNGCPAGTTPDECTGIINRQVDADFAKLIGADSLDGYTRNYRSASDYEGRIADGESLKDIGMRASANQKLANDALARTLGTQRDALKQQSAGVIKLIERGIQAEGHGNQLQTANALAGAQAIQLQEMRSLMLASENARAAQAQAEADREARELAASRGLRRSLRDSARSQRKGAVADEQY